MAEGGLLAFILFFAVGWALIVPFLAAYESGCAMSTDQIYTNPSMTEPDGSNPLTLVWDYFSWYKDILTFKTTPMTSGLTYILFTPLFALGIYAIIK